MKWSTATLTRGRGGLPLLSWTSAIPPYIIPPSAPALCEGIAQVVVRLDDPLVIPTSILLLSVIRSSAFIGSRRVFSGPVVPLTDTHLTPARKVLLPQCSEFRSRGPQPPQPLFSYLMMVPSNFPMGQGWSGTSKILARKSFALEFFERE